MKRALVSLLILCFALAIGAKDKEVVIAHQYTRAQKLKIPEKTMEVKLPNLVFNEKKGNTDLAKQISGLLNSIVSDDFEHYIFSLSLHESDDGVQVSVNAFDPFNEPAEMLTSYLGTVKVAHCYFLVRNGQSQGLLLKSVFSKDKSKTNFVRVFELVQSPTELHDTHVVATYNNTTLQATELVICGENKLYENN